MLPIFHSSRALKVHMLQALTAHFSSSLPGFSRWLRAREKPWSFDECVPVYFDCVAFLPSLDVVILFLTFHIVSCVADIWVQVHAGPACQRQCFRLVCVDQARSFCPHVDW
jgi:hypothetical protein